MKILLVGNYLPDRQESMQRFAEIMVQELLLAGHEVRHIRPTVRLGQISLPNKFQKWIGYIDKFLLFPSALRRAAAWADVVHICDHSNSMYVKHVASRPHLITCHDLLAVRSARGEFPVNPVGITGKLFQKWIARGLKSAQFIVCDSNATLNDCKRVLEINAERLDVVYLGLNYPYRPMPLAEADERLGKLGISNKRRYLMHVGNNSWYKNRLVVLKIFSQLVTDHQRDIDLIVAGRNLTPEMIKFIIEAGIENRVKELGLVSNEDLCALYSRADGLIFPSLEEGFGWPVLEAQASGCPVFTSKRAPMTEVGGDAAVYIDPLSPEHSALVIDQHLDSLQEMRNAGLKNAMNFSNTNMRDTYLKIYAQIVLKYEENHICLSPFKYASLGRKRSKEIPVENFRVATILKNSVLPWLRLIRNFVQFRWALMRSASVMNSTISEQKILFVSGCGRSGTTILGDLLGAHPDAYLYFEPWYLWAAIDPRLDLINLHVKINASAILDESYYSEEAGWRFKKLFHGKLFSQKKGGFVVEKTPQNALRIRYLEKLVPGACYVNIVRDGFEVVESINELASNNLYRIAAKPNFNQWWGDDQSKWLALKRDAAKLGYAAGELDQLFSHRQKGALEWMLSLQEVERARDALGDRFVEVRYDNLVCQPVAVLNGIVDRFSIKRDSVWTSKAKGMVRPNKALNKVYEPLILPPKICADFNELQREYGFPHRAVSKTDRPDDRNHPVSAASNAC